MWCGLLKVASVSPPVTVLKSGCPKTLVAALPLSVPAAKVPFAENGKYKTRLCTTSDTSSPLVPVNATPYGLAMVELLGSLMEEVKLDCPSTRSAVTCPKGCENGAGKRSTRP